VLVSGGLWSQIATDAWNSRRAFNVESLPASRLRFETVAAAGRSFGPEGLVNDAERSTKTRGFATVGMLRLNSSIRKRMDESRSAGQEWYQTLAQQDRNGPNLGSAGQEWTKPWLSMTGMDETLAQHDRNGPNPRSACQANLAQNE